MSTEQNDILVFSDWYLPGYRAGGPIRSLSNLVGALDHNFYIVTRNTDHHHLVPYENVETGKWIQRRKNEWVFYIEEEKLNRTLVRKLIEEKNYHRIYLNSLFSKKFTLLPLKVAGQLGLIARVVLAPRGMLGAVALSVKPVKKKLFLLHAKWTKRFGGIKWHATNQDEAREIRDAFGDETRIVVAPNIATAAQGQMSKPEKKPGELRLITIARISPEKGIYQALDYLRLANLDAAIQWKIFGTQQNRWYLEMCKELASRIHDIQIEFCGEIESDKIPAELEKHHFFYLATGGENYGHAIVEALASGTPVIISNKTPWRDLKKSNAGWDLPHQSQAFAEVLDKALRMNNEEYLSMSASASSLGKVIASDPATIKAYETLFW